jgi:NAD(P)-dependent dehydrogenase (short-subunit alcohol dehydrogenase family)
MNTEYNPFSLVGKTILVTGASSGIGRATAISCAKMGANVIITGRNQERLAETLVSMPGDQNLSIAADLTNAGQIDALVADIPQLNGVVHCAGVGDRTLLKMAREKDIERVMSANFNAPVSLQRALLKKSLCLPVNSDVGHRWYRFS